MQFSLFKKVFSMPMMIGVSSLFVILCLHTIFGCSSTSSGQVKQKEDDVAVAEKKADGKNAEKQQPVPDVDIVISWKNKGFGSPEPAWITKSLVGNYQSIREKHPELQDKTLILVHAAGLNLDYLENSTAHYDVTAKVPDATNITSVDSGWVQIRPAPSKVAADYYEYLHVYACQRAGTPSVIVVQVQ